MKPRKRLLILFLDVDGVLNTFAYIMENLNKGQTPEDNAKMIMSAKVALLNELIQKTGCKVIVNSSWRRIEGWWQSFELAGINMEAIEGVTDCLDGKLRGDEIQLWMDRHEIPREDIVIFDDLPAPIFPGLEDRLVEMGKCALTEERCNQALRLWGLEKEVTIGDD